MTAQAKHTNHHHRGRYVALVMGLVLPHLYGVPAQGYSSAPTFILESRKLKAAGITPENILTAIYADLETVPSALTVADQETATALDLRSVQFHGRYNPGVWLRTQCKGPTQTFVLEECRGSVCTPTAPSKGRDNPRHGRAFVGEYGRYALSRASFEKQPLEGTRPDARVCQRAWPTWALSAKAMSAHADLEFPRHLMFIQMADRVKIFDVLRMQLWNSFAWNESRGVFSHVTVASDGRILLRSNAGDGLLMDFSENKYVAVSQGVVTTSVHGLNDLFSSDALKSEVRLNLEKESHGKPTLTLGGLWWKNGFVSWKDAMLALALKTPPVLREYPEARTLAGALWSEQSGVEKSYILLHAGNRLELHTSTDARIFTKASTFSLDEQQQSTGQFLVHPDFLTQLNPTGVLRFMNSGVFHQEAVLLENSSAVQNAFDILSYSKTSDPTKCHVGYFTPRSNSSGWLQKVSLSSVPCTTGLGRGPTTAGLVEWGSEGIKVYSIK